MCGVCTSSPPWASPSACTRRLAPACAAPWCQPKLPSQGCSAAVISKAAQQWSKATQWLWRAPAPCMSRGWLFGVARTRVLALGSLDLCGAEGPSVLCLRTVHQGGAAAPNALMRARPHVQAGARQPPRWKLLCGRPAAVSMVSARAFRVLGHAGGAAAWWDRLAACPGAVLLRP